MDILRELAFAWYDLLTTVNVAAGRPLLELSNSVGLPIVAVLILGLLATTSPCQVTTNAGALAFISRRLDPPSRPLLSALAYLLGKVFVYTLIGAAVIFAGRELAVGSVPAVAIARKALGPLMILVGLFLLGTLQLNVSVGHGLNHWLRERTHWGGLRGSFLLGVAFALAFCPTLFWLFFGLTIPLALSSPIGLLYPPTFALGATLPLLALAGLFTLGIRQSVGYLQGLRRANRILGWVTGFVLILAGLNDTFIYWFL